MNKDINKGFIKEASGWRKDGDPQDFKDTHI